MKLTALLSTVFSSAIKLPEKTDKSRTKALERWFKIFFAWIEREFPRIWKYLQPFLTKRFWNLPNILTLLRFPGTLLIVAYIYSAKPLAALIAYCLVALLDAIDGPIARAMDCVTTSGKILDPTTDKVQSILTLLILNFQIMWVWDWSVYLLAIGEFYYFGLRVGKLANKDNNIDSEIIGKTKYVLQCIVIVVLMLVWLWDIKKAHVPYGLELLPNFILVASLVLLYFNIIRQTISLLKSFFKKP